MRHGFIRRAAGRRILGPALATALLAFGACSNDNNNYLMGIRRIQRIRRI